MSEPTAATNETITIGGDLVVNRLGFGAMRITGLVSRQSEDVLDYCEREGIAFIPWFPLAAGKLTREGTVLDDVAKKLDASAAQVALAWVLKRSPVMLPIPGTSRVKHLEENVDGAGLELTDDDFRRLDLAGREEWASRTT